MNSETKMTSLKVDCLKLVINAKDANEKVVASNYFINYLADPSNNVNSADFSTAIDTILIWIRSCNFRVAQAGLDVLLAMCERLNADYNIFVPVISLAVIDQLGNSKVSVRDKCRLLLSKMVEKKILDPQNVLDKMIPYFTCKNKYIRDEVLNYLRFVVDQCGIDYVNTKRFLPFIVKSLIDSNLSIRENAVKCLLTLYRHFGDELRIDLRQENISGLISSQKLQQILKKFDEIKSSDDFLSSAIILDKNQNFLVENDDKRGRQVEVTREKKKLASIQHNIKSFNKENFNHIIQQYPASSTNTVTDNSRKLGILKSSKSSVCAGHDDKRGRQGQVARGKKKLSSVKTNIKSLNKENFNHIIQQYPASHTNTVTDEHPRKLGALKSSSSSVCAGGVDEEYFINAFNERIDLQISSEEEIEGHMFTAKEIIGNVSTDWNKRVEALKKLRGLVATGIAKLKNFTTQLCLLEPSFECAVRDLRSQVVREACITIAFLANKLKNNFEWFAERILPHVVLLLLRAAKIMSTSGLTCLQLIFQHTHSHRLVPIIINQLSSRSKEIRKAVCILMNLIINTWSNHLLKRCSPFLEDGIKRGIADPDSEARDYARNAYWAFQNHFPEKADALLNSIDSNFRRTLLSKESNYITCSSSSTTSNSEFTMVTARSFQQKLEGRPKCMLGGNHILTPTHTHSAVDLQLLQEIKPKIPCQKAKSETSLLESRNILHEGDVLSVGTEQDQLGQTSNKISRTLNTQLSYYSRLPNGVSNFRPSELSLITNSSVTDKSISSLGQCKELKIVDKSRSPSSNQKKSLKKLNFITSKKNSVASTRINPIKIQNLFQPLTESKHSLSQSLYNPSDESQQKSSKNNSQPICCELNKIITDCESTSWYYRKKGFVALKMYFRDGNLLKHAELKRVTNTFNKLFADSYTKDFGLFLEILNYLIVAHKTDLNYWLDILLCKLLSKLGNDILVSTQKKIIKFLDTVQESFSSDIQMSAILKYLCDSARTPNSRVKIAACNYIVKLAVNMDSGLGFLSSTTEQFKNSAITALSKIVEWTMAGNLKKDIQLKKAAQEAIIALFNLDRCEVTLFLSFLPKVHQEVAYNLIEENIRQFIRNTSFAIESNGSVPVASSCSLITPAIHHHHAISSINPFDSTLASAPERNVDTDKENINFIDTKVESNPKKQTFGYKSIVNVIGQEKPLKNSSVGQFSSNIIDQKPLVQQTKKYQFRTNLSNWSSTNGRCLTAQVPDKITTKSHENPDTSYTIEENIDDINNNKDETILKVLESLKSSGDIDKSIHENFTVSFQEIITSLSQLIQIVKDNSYALLNHFKSILCIILTYLDNSDQTVQLLLLSLLTEMIKSTVFEQLFNDYVEILLLKILNSSKNGSGAVRKSAENCTSTIAALLSPDLVIRILVPLIKIEDYPINLYAIKTLTKLVEARDQKVVLNYLPDVMSALIHAYESEMSSVRKSAVFCMVALHTCVGEALFRPYVSSLCGSKLKLLEIYIKRSEDVSIPTV